MAIAQSATLLEVIRQAQLLDESQLGRAEQLARGLPDATRLGRELVRQGMLTAWQVNEVAAGRASGLRLGVYVLLELLGRGNMGQVFKARQQRLKRLVALKTIHPECLADPHTVQRFHREAEAAARLDHPNIIRIYDADEVNGIHFLAMEYVDGTDLGKLLQQQGQLPVGLACEYIKQAARGLQHAHEQGLVHRDIKPSNLMLSFVRGQSSVVETGKLPGPRESSPADHGPRTTDHGQIKILDLGLARLQRSPAGDQTALTLTQTGTAMGTPVYMAPEQALDARTADIRADIYSLGCTLYHLLAGRPPFLGHDLAQMIAMHMAAEPQRLDKVRPEVPGGLADVVAKMLAKKPEQRLATPSEVAQALEPWASVPSQSPGSGTTFGSLRPDTGGSPHLAATEADRVGSPLAATPRKSTGDTTVKDKPPGRRRRVLGWLLAFVVLLAGGGLAVKFAAPEWFDDAVESVQSFAESFIAGAPGKPTSVAELKPPPGKPTSGRELKPTPPNGSAGLIIVQPAGSVPVGNPIPDVIYVPTPHAVVEEMLRLANVQPGEVVFDLGSGDGRIPIAAAQKFGARAYGYEIDAALVVQSQQAVKKNQLEHLVTIERRDIFKLDLRGAHVVTLYLLPSLNEKLLPQLEKMKPGSRIVSHNFDMPGVKAKTVKSIKATNDLGDVRDHTIYLWTVPLQR